MPFCAKCGANYQLGQSTCAECYQSLKREVGDLPNIAQMPERPVEASKTRRIVAGAIDIAVVVAIALLLLSPKFRFLSMAGTRRIIAFGAPSIYLLLRDFIDGKSIGKLITGLTAYNVVEKKSAGLAESIIRNWYLGIPLLGPTLFTAIACLQILFKNSRWGDGMANTIVIKDQEMERL